MNHLRKIAGIIVLCLAITLLIVSCNKGDDTGLTNTDQTNGQQQTNSGDTATNSDSVVDSSSIAVSDTEKTPETSSVSPVTEAFDESKYLIKESDTAYKLVSLDGNSEMNIFVGDNSQLTYNLRKKNSAGEFEDKIKDSLLGVYVDNDKYGIASSFVSAKAEKTDREYSFMGNQSKIQDKCITTEFTLNQDGKTFYIDVKMFDNGIAFRYRLPATSTSTLTRRVRDEYTTFSLCDEATKSWYGVSNKDYEAEINEHNTNTASQDKITGPITAVIGNREGYIAIMEAGITSSYGGTNYYALGDGVYKISNTWNNTIAATYNVRGDITTGWRLVNIADSLNDLVNNYNVYNVCDLADPEIYNDTSWIEAGRATWSWLVSYSSGLSTDELMYEFTLAAAKLGFEYNIVDDGWPVWDNYEEALSAIGQFGEDVNVKQMLWCAITSGTVKINKITNVKEAQSFFDMLNRCGFAGAKVDFWWSEEQTQTAVLQAEILKMAAEYKMVIDFHGCSKSGGMNITFPNELTREAVRGLENIGNATNTNYTTQASWLSAQLFTRYLNGHADWTPACDSAMQIAMLVCTDSPLMVIATDPSDILENEAVELIKSIPTVWDRTVVLDSSIIGSRAIYAKEKSGVWYLGGIFAKAGSIEVKLSDFLGDGEYIMELWEDSSVNQKVKTVKNVTKDDVLTFNKKAATGFTARLTKLTLSQYGGEIKDAIKIETVSSDSVVKYTTDGSDPMTSASAITYEAPIVLTKTCRLRVAIVSGDGEGSAMSYNFNKIVVNTVSAKTEYEDASTKVTIIPTITDSKIYYTTDGTPASAQSTPYTGTITFTEKCTVNAIIIPNDKTLSSKTIKIAVLIRSTISHITPDEFLGSDYVSMVSGWNNTYGVDKSMNGTKISLGGLSANSGTVFEHGISLNATGYFIYNVPQGATKFVGVVGIDDSVYNNTTDGAKASALCKIYFDQNIAYTSQVFRQGQYYLVEIDVPAGATQIKIEFNDAGDGITCDNVSMGNAGWVK